MGEEELSERIAQEAERIAMVGRPLEFIARCKVAECGWDEAWSTEPAAQAAGVWHVYDAHPEMWRELIPDHRPPLDQLPATLGRRLEDWERQS